MGDSQYTEKLMGIDTDQSHKTWTWSRVLKDPNRTSVQAFSCCHMGRSRGPVARPGQLGWLRMVAIH